MRAKVETKFGTLHTATKFRYIIVGAPRMTGGGFGTPFAYGYAATAEAALKRVRRYGVGGLALAVYEVADATGQEVTR